MESEQTLTPELLSQIEAYYAGSLAPEEATRLRDHLNADPGLARAAASWEALHRYALRPQPEDPAEFAHLRGLLADAEAGLTKTSAARHRLPPRLLLAVAAAVLLLVVAGWWGLGRPDATGTLARESFAFLPREGLLLGPETTGEAAMAAYDRQAYDRAYPALRAGVAEGSLDTIALLYAGVSAVALNRPEEARAIFTELLETGSVPEYETDIRYYLALAELQSGNPTSARTQLEQAGGGARVQRLIHALDELEK